MTKVDFSGFTPTWCPGCGNYGILAAIKKAFEKLNFGYEDVAMVYDIGCSGNMNDFLWANSIHALHGRTVPTAVGIKIANHKLAVVAVAGDGGCYGEGGNHLIHAARGNHDITVIVHDNRVYGLTTGQVAPTAFKGFRAKSTPFGVIEITLNPLALVLAQGATFVAQGFATEIDHLTDIIFEAIKHKGFSLVNVFQQCVSFNKINNLDWYKERIYKLTSQNHDPSNFKKAMEKAMELEEKLPIGIIYKEERETYTDQIPQLKQTRLVDLDLKTDVSSFIAEFV